jgi:hypothetical protein
MVACAAPVNNTGSGALAEMAHHLIDNPARGVVAVVGACFSHPNQGCGGEAGHDEPVGQDGLPRSVLAIRSNCLPQLAYSLSFSL